MFPSLKVIAQTVGSMLRRIGAKTVLFITLSFILLFNVRSCLKPPATDMPKLVPLAPEDKLRVTVSDSHIFVQDGKKVVRRYVPPSGSASVTVKKDDRVEIRVKRTGFTFEPGLGVMASDRLRVTLDGRFAYVGRFGLSGGVALSGGSPVCVGYVGATYVLDQIKLPNTSLVVGYTTRQDIGVGIRVRL